MSKSLWLNKKNLSDDSLERHNIDNEPITELHACFNYISKFSISSSHCSLLTVLSLSCNNLTEIPDLHGTATCCIQELCLANNKIHVVDNLQYYPELRILDLRHNAITVLENIGNKEHLVRLSLSCNKIMDVNFKYLTILPKLQYLGLFDNKIDTSFPMTQLLSHTPLLRHLFVGCNPLSKGNFLAVNNLLLEQYSGHFSTGHVDKHVLLRNNDMYLLIESIVSSSPSIKMIDGYYI